MGIVDENMVTLWLTKLWKMDEDGPFTNDQQMKRVLFHSYVKLPKGNMLWANCLLVSGGLTNRNKYLFTQNWSKSSQGFEHIGAGNERPIWNQSFGRFLLISYIPKLDSWIMRDHPFWSRPLAAAQALKQRQTREPPLQLWIRKWYQKWTARRVPLFLYEMDGLMNG